MMNQQNDHDFHLKVAINDLLMGDGRGQKTIQEGGVKGLKLGYTPKGIQLTGRTTTKVFSLSVVTHPSMKKSHGLILHKGWLPMKDLNKVIACLNQVLSEQGRQSEGMIFENWKREPPFLFHRIEWDEKDTTVQAQLIG